MSTWEYNPAGQLHVVKWSSGPDSCVMHELMEKFNTSYDTKTLRAYAARDVEATWAMYEAFPYHEVIEGEIVEERRAIEGGS
jgi:hypothetical protein